MSGNWSAVDVITVIAVFGLAGLCEIGGGWLVWQAVREVRTRGSFFERRVSRVFTMMSFADCRDQGIIRKPSSR